MSTRITDNVNFNAIRDSIHRTKSRMTKAQHEMSSLKKLNAPSDDPVGAIKVLEIRTDKVNNDQFFDNLKLAENFLQNTDNVLEGFLDIVVRAKEIAINQASGASSTDETRLGISEEVDQLYQRAVALGNTRIGDRFIFGGYRTGTPPVADDGRYLGDDGEMMAEISKEVYVSMNLPGFEIFNTSPQHSDDAKRVYGTPEDEQNRAPAKEFNTLNRTGEENVNLFGELQGLRIALLSGDLESIRGTLERLDELGSSVLATRAKVGSRLAGLQGAERSLDRTNLINANLNQAIEDADLIGVMNDLAKEETVFRSVLSSSQRLVQPSLMEFLR